MIYCLFKSFCEPKAEDLEHQYQCCNSCKNNKCTNRCKDDHKTCRLMADKTYIEELERKSNMAFGSNIQDRPKKIIVDKNDVAMVETKPENIKSSLTDKEIAKRESRRKRREARKNKK